MPKSKKEYASIDLCATDSTEESSDADSNAANTISPRNDSSDNGANLQEVNEARNVVGVRTDLANLQEVNEARNVVGVRTDFDNVSDTAAAKEDDYMIAPSTKEEKDNERYARKVGINL